MTRNLEVGYWPIVDNRLVKSMTQRSDTQGRSKYKKPQIILHLRNLPQEPASIQSFY